MKKRIIASIMAIAASASITGVLPSATAQADWIERDGKKYYYNEDNSMASNAWLYFADQNKWFHVDYDGSMHTNKWLYDDFAGKWCYVGDDGAKVVNNWVYYENDWYLVDEEGARVENQWRKIGDEWYFFDRSGKEAFGSELFTTPGVTTVVEENKITQTGKFNGVEFQFTIDLSGWEQKTSPEQIRKIADLFWDCYPKMYERFGEALESPTKVDFCFHQSGNLAATSGSRVSIDDNHLRENGSECDFDCITHEFAHVINHLYDSDQYNCIDVNLVETFAEYCRFVYAYKDGYYNDKAWEMRKASHVKETSAPVSKRFLVWLDYKCFSQDKDVIYDIMTTWYNKDYRADEWDDVWKNIFAGTDLEGKTIKEAWDEYKNDVFANTDATASEYGGTSDLIRIYDARNMLLRGQ